MAMIAGVQQVGIGCTNTHDTFKWLRKIFEMNVRIFDEQAEAPLMTRYTGGNIHKRRAILAMNMNGGGGAEIWQFTSRTPIAGKKMHWGDLGINAVKLKSTQVEKSHKEIHKHYPCSDFKTAPDKHPTFFVSDPEGNKYQVVKDHKFFRNEIHMQGGVCGAIIGVSHMELSMAFYQNGFGFDEIVYDITGTFNDLGEEYNETRFRRVLLKFNNPGTAPFSRLIGDAQIELIQALDRKAEHLFQGRYWGDIGFIHLCFDVPDLDRIRLNLQKFGYTLTVDSGETFDMGDSGGRFAYVEDPDGTLIELVETHKVPVLKKFGWYINLKKRGFKKPLPDWMVGILAIHRVKD